jgi:DNA-binding CsgD family transcriptional regulator
MRMGPLGERGGLLERQRELGRIESCLQSARQGHGRALVLEGPAGIGKTVLLAAGRDWAEGEGIRVLRARGAELEREFAFGVVRQLVEPIVAAASEEELEGPPGLAARLLGLPGISHRVDSTAPIPPDPSFAVLHGLYWLCANLASERPLALVVDDVHWADAASLRFLAFLLPRLEELHVAVLLGARPAEAGESRELLAALAMDPATDVVPVGPLSIAGVAALIAAGLRVEPEPEFAAACVNATGGTPFLVRTLVEALRQEHIAPVAASAATLQNVATSTLDRWVMLRLARLGPDAARLARAVAILERSNLDQATQLAGLPPSDAARAADLLVRAGVLDETPLSFAHPLLRGAVYRDLSLIEKSEAHGRAAKLLDLAHASPARVAEHLLATNPAGDDAVVEQLRTAAREAAARGAPESAVAYLRRAMTEPPSPTTKGAILLELGLAEFRAGQPGWQNQLEDAVELANDDAARIAITLLFANALRWHERPIEAIKVCDRVAAQLDGHNTEGHLVLEAMAVVCGVLDAASAPSVADRASALLEHTRERSVPPSCVLAMAYVAALVNQPAEQVAELALRAVAASTPPPQEPINSPWLPNSMFRHPSVVLPLVWAERYDAAQGLADAAVAEAQASANGMILPAVLAQRAWLAFRLGDLTAAEADSRALLETSGPVAPPIFRNRALCVLVDVLVERGELDEAEHTLKTLADDLAGAALSATIFRHTRGHLSFARGRFADALDDFQAAGAIATSGLGLSPSYLAWRSDAALAALAIGDCDTARSLSDEELGMARAFGAPRTLGVALRAVGLVTGGHTGEQLLRESAEVLAGPDTKLEMARTLADLGALLRRGNHRVEARELLRQAVDIAHHLAATALAQRAETELRAAGAKPRRVRLSGLEALTASERRIAEMAAQGLTNREIAQALFVTSRTVEGHLTHVFEKLNVAARTGLTAALATPTQATRS